MASTGAMSEFARMPTSRKVLVFVVIGALFGFLYYRFAYKSLTKDLEKAKGLHAAAAGANKTIDEDIKAFNKLRPKKKKIDRKITELQKALPTEAEVPAFFETLERKITESGVEVLKWNKRPEAPVERFVKVPLEVEITGTFLQIKRFFASLVEKKLVTPDPNDERERERIVSIEDLSLTSPAVRNRELIMTAKFIAVTFRQGDAPVPPAGSAVPSTVTPAPAAGTAPAPMPSSSTPPPPAPNTATPAGAKAATEDALKQDAKRVEDGPAKADGSARLKGGL